MEDVITVGNAAEPSRGLALTVGAAVIIRGAAIIAAAMRAMAFEPWPCPCKP